MTDSRVIVQAHCNRCLGETRHFVEASKKQELEEENSDGTLWFWETNLYEMLECCGCERVTLRCTREWIGDPEPGVTYFPAAVTRPSPSWLSDSDIWQTHSAACWLFEEVYAALHLGSNRLALMGARTIIDMVMLDKVGDQGTFAEGLKKMEEAGHISGTNRTYLEAAIDAGSAVAHRGHRPKDEDVNRVMDIVENLVQAVYLLGFAADTLRENTPPRPTKPPVA